MLKRLRNSIALTLFIFFLFTTSAFASTTVNIITTNDMHGVLEESNTAIGVAQASAMKASTPNSLLIDSGDATQGTTLATINKGNDVIRLMNAAGFDAMVAGNHEFDYGSEQLLKNANTATFPILSANANYGDGTLLPATQIMEVAGKKIGLIGITTSTTNTSTNPSLRPGVTFGNEIETAKKEIAKLSGKVDTILLLTHLGNDQTAVPVTSLDLLNGLSDSELSQIAAVLDGHSHTIEDTPYIRGNYNIPVIQDQTQMTYIGKVVITFEDNGLVSATEEVMDYDTAMGYPLTDEGEKAKQETLNAIEEINQEQAEITGQVIGKTATPLWGGYVYWDYAEPRIVETNFGDLVTDAFRTKALEYAQENGLTNEVIGIINGGGVSNSINPGNITVGDILNAFNHGNSFVILKITPSDLYAVIESGLVTTGQSKTGLIEREKVSGSFIQPSGFYYSYDPSQPEGQKLFNVFTYNGTVLDRNDTTTELLVGTQNYVQSFIPNAELVVQDLGEDQVIEDYISNYGSIINLPENGERIFIHNDKSPQTYDIRIPVYSSEDQGLEEPFPQSNKLIQINIDNEGYKFYTTDDNGNVNITLEKGPHSLIALGGTSPVYVNNYSGAGLEYTKPGYYSFNFYIDPKNIGDNVQVEINPSELLLGVGEHAIITSADVEATIISEIDEDYNITWSSNDPRIASVYGRGTTATITSVSEGSTYVTATLDNGYSTSIYVECSSTPIVIDQYFIDTPNPDYFTFGITQPMANPTLNYEGDIKKVSIFTWSAPDMSDLDCKAIFNSDNEDWSYTFPVNNTPINNYYLNSDKINVNVYASFDEESDGYLVAANTFSMANYESFYDKENNSYYSVGYIAYNQNIGFDRPTVFNGMTSGEINNPNSIHMEGLRVSSPAANVKVQTQVHASDIGWMNPVEDGQYAGTMWQNRAIESVKLSLYGDGQNIPIESIEYRVYQNNNWTDWVNDGQEAGITGQNLPIQAVEIRIVKPEI